MKLKIIGIARHRNGVWRLALRRGAVSRNTGVMAAARSASCSRNRTIARYSTWPSWPPATSPSARTAGGASDDHRSARPRPHEMHPCNT